MKKQLPREGFSRPRPGEQDIPDMGPDVEGHGLNDVTKPFDHGVAGTPGSDGFAGLPRTGGELTDDDGSEGGPTSLR